MSVRVYLNKQDVNKPGEHSKRCQTCPLARKLKVKLGRKVAVMYRKVAVFKKNNRTLDYYLVPSAKAVQFIVANDLNGGGNPGHYSFSKDS